MKCLLVLFCLTFTTCAFAQQTGSPSAQVSVIRAGTLIDGKSDKPRRDQVIVIRGNRIESVADAASAKIGTFLVAEDSFVCACVYVEPRGEDRSYLGLLAVDPKLQKSGLGSQLMKAAEAYCVKAGSRFMDLRIVSVRKELPAFYHRHGYVETGTEPFTPGLNPKVPCHFVVMSKPLT